MKRTILFACILMVISSTNAESVLEILSHFPYTDVPYYGGVDSRQANWQQQPCEMPFFKSEISDQSYVDWQQQIPANYETVLQRLCFRKFSLSDTKLFSLYSETADVSGNMFLVALKEDGSFSSSLHVEQTFYGDSRAIEQKTFSINADSTVTVYAINQVNGNDTVYGAQFTSFLGYRVDKKYAIANGEFELIQTTTYVPKTYCSSEMQGIHIYNGTENVESAKHINRPLSRIDNE